MTVERQNAKLLADRENASYILKFGPPGICCLIIVSIGWTDLALVFAEPSFSGIHDMGRAISVVTHFGIKSIVCKNKLNLNEKNTFVIENY